MQKVREDKRPVAKTRLEKMKVEVTLLQSDPSFLDITSHRHSIPEMSLGIKTDSPHQNSAHVAVLYAQILKAGYYRQGETKKTSPSGRIH